VSDAAEHWQEEVTEPTVRVESGVRQKIQRAPLDGLRVLWLDPDRACSAECRAMLVSWGATIVVVENPGTGLDTAAITRPDVVVISCDGGGHSPDQLARVLHFMIPDPPPVVLVSKLDLRGFEGALPGVVRLLPKPFDPRAMLDVMKRIEHG
jgi:DNA-binding NtrC family response regulator